MDEVRRLHQANRAGWNEGAADYEESLEEEIEFLRSGGSRLLPPEREALQDLASWCRRAIHLQCGGGSDTLSLWNMGAQEVVGLDISERMIAVAQAKSKALAAPALWVCSDVLDAPHDLDGTGDLVYTGQGAICWIQDLAAWARTVSRLLKPGGMFLLYEGHPVAGLWDLDAESYQLDRDYGDYFCEKPIASIGWPSTYIGDLGKPAHQHAPKWERSWRTDQIVNSLIKSGLRIERMGEHPDLFWDTFPNMPPDLIRRLPQTLSLVARKPTN